MNWVALVILLALIEYSVFGGLVGRARVKYAVSAPAVTGHPLFERFFRVHQNSLEQLIVFVPAVWLFGLFVSAKWAAIIGAVFLAARILYAIGYVAAPERREAGAWLTALAEVVLVIGALIGVIRSIAAA